MYQFSEFARAEICDHHSCQHTGAAFNLEMQRRMAQPVRRYGNKSLRIYLAGAIEKHCWRHQIVPELRGVIGVGDEEHFHTDDLWTLSIKNTNGDNPVLGRHIYVGPFFLSCDHGCAHGDMSHGAGADGRFYCGDGFKRDQVRSFCKQQIDSADLVFAWINRADAYGTIWELGYAAAKKKTLVVRWPEDFDISEMWLSLPEDARPAKSVIEAFCESVGPSAQSPEDEKLTPIERTLLDALLRRRAQNSDECRFVLAAQHSVLNGKYRLDFAIWREGKPWRIAVECDGHNFHEKTKEQVARDKARERDLIFEGWTVLRFSGTEIHRDADGCAETIVKHCLRLDQ